MKLAVVGATGLVGSVILKVLEEGKYLSISDSDELILTASHASVGKKIAFNGKELSVISIEDAITKIPDIAIFSAGSDTSIKYAREFTKHGSAVVDNSAAWRMYPDVPLVVPEVNIHTVNQGQLLIANPNCTTIQLVMALAPLHLRYGIKRIVISTYQSVTGSGVRGVSQLENERKGKLHSEDKFYPHQIDLNLFPQAGTFAEDGYNTEEAKIINETRKILGDESIMISPTVVRVPVIGGHSESVNVELKVSFEINEVRKLISEMPGIIVLDEPLKSIYPMPITAHGRDEVFVGRIRRDNSCENALNLWIVADNLRKGAATNAVQIAASILSNRRALKNLNPIDNH